MPTDLPRKRPRPEQNICETRRLLIIELLTFGLIVLVLTMLAVFWGKPHLFQGQLSGLTASANQFLWRKRSDTTFKPHALKRTSG